MSLQKILKKQSELHAVRIFFAIFALIISIDN